MKDKIKKNKVLFSTLLFIRYIGYSIYYLFFMTIFRIFSIKKNKVVISNYYGKGYGDNAKYICDELLSKDSNVDIVWLCNNINDKSIPENIRKVKFNSIKGLYELTTAHIWMDNCRKYSYIRKRKGQFYIQLWHGCLMLKKIEFDVEKQLGVYYSKNMKKDNEMIDLFISNSKYFNNRCRESFKYSGEILECGEPKDDILLSNYSKISDDFRKKNGLKDKKIILYAPTFRLNYDKNPYDIDFESLYSAYKKTGEDVVFLIRLHPNVKEDRISIHYNDHIINMTNYPDMQDLLAASDILITDYSSIMFESMLIDKYVLLYANDIDTYIDDRGFYYSLNELPFPLTINNEELEKALLNFKNFDAKIYNEMKKEIGLFNKFDSAKSIANIVIDLTKGE